eukprot:m.13987 g.13987  ORF g.13987 m.13987 type:complete len:78 (+) comp7682_c0_seq5:812-1045(+)
MFGSMQLNGNLVPSGEWVPVVSCKRHGVLLYALWGSNSHVCMCLFVFCSQDMSDLRDARGITLTETTTHTKFTFNLI